MKIGLFIPCYINAVYPEVGVASYKLLKSLGLDVDYPCLLYTSSRHGPVTKAFGILSSEVWNLDVWAQ